MRLEMAKDEAQELKWALDIRLIEMRGELVRASDHAFRNELRVSLSRLERVARRLEEALLEDESGRLAKIEETQTTETNVRPEK